ncbi:MAG: aminodeoxychorismate/anthranilate synthase component II [Saprospiraceae bacterium]|nr:aminodeoxychorismate/anthranilate synthase component II [Saprospiraceae bacterium]
MKILVIDNYDSFTYNLVQYIRELVAYPLDVYRNDAISVEEVDAYDIIILSPGPGLPSQSGITSEVVSRYHQSKSIFGVCLGQQAIGEVFGGKLENLKKVYHGVATAVNIVKDDILFRDLPSTIQAGRYHSWIVKKEQFPEELEITAEDEQGTIMALRHRKYNVRGVQFHPESILTPDGKKMLANFFEYAYKYQQELSNKRSLV